MEVLCRICGALKAGNIKTLTCFNCETTLEAPKPMVVEATEIDPPVFVPLREEGEVS